MKRTIKFRAWHVAEKLMCDIDVLTPAGAFLIGVKNAPDDYFNGGKSIIISPKNGRFCKHDDIDLMQFTGLHDKNGREIYEGDIIRGEQDQNIFIGWNIRFASFSLKRDDWVFDHYFGEAIEAEKCEVIGNIWQNP